MSDQGAVGFDADHTVKRLFEKGGESGDAESCKSRSTWIAAVGDDKTKGVEIEIGAPVSETFLGTTLRQTHFVESAEAGEGETFEFEFFAGRTGDFQCSADETSLRAGLIVDETEAVVSNADIVTREFEKLRQCSGFGFEIPEIGR